MGGGEFKFRVVEGKDGVCLLVLRWFGCALTALLSGSSAVTGVSMQQ